MRTALVALGRVQVVVPVLLAAGLLAFAFVLGDLPTAFSRIRGISGRTLLACFALATMYWLLKWILFRRLLAGIGIEPDWQRLAAAYAVGEVCLPIPAGLYAQNWVLRRIHGADIALSAAATTGILAVEGTLLMLTLIGLGIPGWPWLRPAVLGLMGLLGAAFLVFMSRYGHRPARNLTQTRGRRLRAALYHFSNALRMLARPALLAQATVLTALYLSALLLAFFLLGRDVGNPDLTMTQAATVYLFALGISMLSGGALSQLGTVESVGIGVGQVWGYPSTEVLAMLLGFRLVWMGSVWLISAACLVLVRDRIRHAARRVHSAEHDVQKSAH